MAGEQTVRDYVTLVRGITYKGNLVGKPGPALLGLGSIQLGGGFREGDYKTYGGDCPPKLMLTPGDLFVSLKGATKDGKMICSVARVPTSVPSGRLTQDTVKLEFRDTDKAKASSYLYWLLRTPQYRAYCEGRARGSAVVALSREDFLDYPVPRLTATRTSIVELLERIEDKIELNRRMNATLESMARALFQSWFVDFDPVRAKLGGNQPIGIDFATSVLFPDSFQLTEASHIPEGWDVKSLGEILELAYGKPLKAENRKNGSICVYGSNGPVGWHDEQLVSGPGIVVGRKGNPGVVTWSHGDFYPIDTAFYVEPKGECRSLYFLFHALSNHNLENLSADSAVPGLNRNHAYMSRQVLPPALLLKAFDKQVEPIFSAVYANILESRTLATLRDTLLPKLLSGEIWVKDMA
ncbi:MAG: restriction endonuclease subunit S [Verrucomicrobia bacterium]|nr:restriction endonuclease subunit S [Verrucomicrobiota bacterium]